MYFRIPNEIIDTYGEQLGAYGLSILMCLARFANQELVCWPAVTTLAKRTGMSRRQALKQINLLKELGLIEITPQYNPETKEFSSNLYTLLFMGGIAPHSVPPTAQHSVPNAPRAYKQNKRRSISPKKERSYSVDDIKEEKRNYRPEEYADIILG